MGDRVPAEVTDTVVQLWGGKSQSTPSSMVSARIEKRWPQLSLMTAALMADFVEWNPCFRGQQAIAFGEALRSLLLLREYQDTTEGTAAQILGMAWEVNKAGNMVASLRLSEAEQNAWYFADLRALLDVPEMKDAGYVEDDDSQEWKQIKHMFLLIWMAVYPDMRQHFSGGSHQRRKTAR